MDWITHDYMQPNIAIFSLSATILELIPALRNMNPDPIHSHRRSRSHSPIHGRIYNHVFGFISAFLYQAMITCDLYRVIYTGAISDCRGL